MKLISKNVKLKILSGNVENNCQLKYYNQEKEKEVETKRKYNIYHGLGIVSKFCLIFKQINLPLK